MNVNHCEEPEPPYRARCYIYRNKIWPLERFGNSSQISSILGKHGSGTPKIRENAGLTITENKYLVQFSILLFTIIDEQLC